MKEYYYLAREYEERYNVDCLSLEYAIAYQQSKDHPNRIAYIRQVLKNKAIDMIRHQKHSVNLTDLGERKLKDAEGFTYETRVLDPFPNQPPDTSHDFFEASQDMSDFDLKVLQFRLEGYMSKEMAEMLGVHKGHVDRAIRRLQERYFAIYGEDT